MAPLSPFRTGEKELSKSLPTIESFSLHPSSNHGRNASRYSSVRFMRISSRGCCSCPARFSRSSVVSYIVKQQHNDTKMTQQQHYNDITTSSSAFPSKVKFLPRNEEIEVSSGSCRLLRAADSFSYDPRDVMLSKSPMSLEYATLLHGGYGSNYRQCRGQRILPLPLRRLPPRHGGGSLFRPYAQID